MQRVLGVRFWYFSIGGWLANSITWGTTAYLWLVGWLKTHAAWAAGWIDQLPAADRAVPWLFGLVFTIIFWKPVWRCLWRSPALGRRLEDLVFPDLNGDWTVELSSNWPRIAAMQKAAADVDGPRYDSHSFENLPLGMPVNLKAHIDQGWTDVAMHMWSEDPAAPIGRSQSLSFDLLRGENGARSVALFFEQKNRAANMAGTDVERFEGAAFLTVSADRQTLEGHYMTKRSWEAGLNTAGTVIFRRMPQPGCLQRLKAWFSCKAATE